VGWPATKAAARTPNVLTGNRTKNFGDIAGKPSSPNTHDPVHPSRGKSGSLAIFTAIRRAWPKQTTYWLKSSKGNQA
jgi:hypothetical protein